MELEWAEAEIRLLPGVYACGAAADGVVVFVDPVHDAAVLHDAVLAVLTILGIQLPVRMLGGAVAPPRLLPVRSPVRVPAAAAAVAAAAILVAGAASALTSLTRGSTPRKAAAPRPPATRPVSPAPTTPVFVPGSPGGGATEVTSPPIAATPVISSVGPVIGTLAVPSRRMPVEVRLARPAPVIAPLVLHLGPPPRVTPPSTPPSRTPSKTPSPIPALTVPSVVIASVAPPVIVTPCVESDAVLTPAKADHDVSRLCGEEGTSHTRDHGKEEPGCVPAGGDTHAHAGQRD